MHPLMRVKVEPPASLDKAAGNRSRGQTSDEIAEKQRYQEPTRNQPVYGLVEA